MNHRSLGASAGAAIGVLAILTLAPPIMAQDSSSARQDTSMAQRGDTGTAEVQNPPGYRDMERPAGLDSAAATTQDSTGGKAHATKKSGMKHKQGTKKATAGGQDSTKWGYKVDKNPKHQNPPGYRGMERPVNALPDSGTSSDSSAPANATSRINQRERQDSLGGRNQNPPGYRGMERPIPGDSAAAGNTSGNAPGDSSQSDQR